MGTVLYTLGVLVMSICCTNIIVELHYADKHKKKNLGTNETEE